VRARAGRAVFKRVLAVAVGAVVGVWAVVAGAGAPTPRAGRAVF
jgi:hypothetical protein